MLTTPVLFPLVAIVLLLGLLLLSVLGFKRQQRIATVLVAGSLMHGHRKDLLVWVAPAPERGEGHYNLFQVVLSDWGSIKHRKVDAVPHGVDPRLPFLAALAGRPDVLYSPPAPLAVTG